MKAEKAVVSGVILVVILAVASMLLSLAGGKIDVARERAVEAESLKRIEGVIDAVYDNDPIGSSRSVSNEVLFGTSTKARYWTLARGDDLTGYAVQVPVPEAYNGEMEVIVGIGTDGRVTGVDVPHHGETASYGGRLIANARFLASFAGLNGHEDSVLWQVSRGEGAFDGVTGATITKTAVTNGVFRALRQYEALTAAGRTEGTPGNGVE